MYIFSFSLEHIVQAASKALDALKKMRTGRHASKQSERKRVKEEGEEGREREKAMTYDHIDPWGKCLSTSPDSHPSVLTHIVHVPSLFPVSLP